jgi:tetraprenyl-beta-curcumene synthase
VQHVNLSRDLHATLWRIVQRRDRIRCLRRLGVRQLSFLARFLTYVIPRAVDELAVITRRAARIPDDALREQALASIREKAYHAEGGSVLATFLRGDAALRHIRIVCALESVYDYLDNLCDRLPGMPTETYAPLHEALLDAIDLTRRPEYHYYRAAPHYEDGGYLVMLVGEIREAIGALPGYGLVLPYLRTSASLYCDLQAKKHLPDGLREVACREWFAKHSVEASVPLGAQALRWYEFAAACGSSLPVFALLALAEEPTLDERRARETYAAYFPAISALHILLDYFIDQAEDHEHQELNFFACYEDEADGLDRLSLLMRTARSRAAALQDGEQHGFLLEAMCGFYLTHPKIFAQSLEAQSNFLLDSKLV